MKVFGGKFQGHREHHIISRKTCMPVFKRNLMIAKSFDLAGRRPVKLDVPNVAADLHAVSTGIHSQGASDGSGDANQAFHSAEAVFSAVGHGSSEVRGRIHVS